MGVTKMSERDLEVVHTVADVVSRRACSLSAVGLVAALKRTTAAVEAGQKVVIGIDGNLYKYHPRFKRYLEKKMRDLVPPELANLYELKEASDGSGIGAAVVAAVCHC